MRHSRCIVLLFVLLFAGSLPAEVFEDSGFAAIELNPVAKGLQLPTCIAHDGTSRMYIVEQRGTIRLLIDGQLQDAPYLDVSDRVRNQGECGLLCVAFHPKFATNGLLYVNYTNPKPKLHTVVSEFKTEPNSTTVDASGERIILSIDQPYSNHNGGQIVFGPDGMLYVGMGDGGSGGDPQNNAQNPRSLLGKILRIDVTPRENYAVPKDNPFVKDSSFRPEIWAWGLRNPWRFTFDRKTGDCYAGDVGQNKYEEVDLIVKGGNYGWRFREGLHDFNMRSTPPRNLIDPIAEYGRDMGLSVTGGFVYRGKKFPQMQGAYFYADYGTGRFWVLRQSRGKVTWSNELKVTANAMANRNNRISPSSFGEDADGELYVTDHGRGVIYRVDLVK